MQTHQVDESSCTGDGRDSSDVHNDPPSRSPICQLMTTTLQHDTGDITDQLTLEKSMSRLSRRLNNINNNSAVQSSELDLMMRPEKLISEIVKEIQDPKHCNKDTGNEEWKVVQKKRYRNRFI
ncbi:unnamed protein product, partial [Iphiclides podalirius]